MFVTLVSIGLGMILNAVRFVVIDTINERTGLCRPQWNDTLLQQHLSAFEALVQNHYRYYQFYSNVALSSVVVYVARLYSITTITIINEAVLVVLLCVFWSTARNSLRQYYRRGSSVLQPKDKTQ